MEHKTDTDTGHLRSRGIYCVIYWPAWLPYPETKEDN